MATTVYIFGPLVTDDDSATNVYPFAVLFDADTPAPETGIIPLIMHHRKMQGVS